MSTRLLLERRAIGGNGNNFQFDDDDDLHTTEYHAHEEETQLDFGDEDLLFQAVNKYPTPSPSSSQSGS